jgi:RHS repeat-associated protein
VPHPRCRQDAESGLRDYDVQYKVGAGGTWTSWLTNTSQTQTLFVGEAGQSYFFQVKATDNVNNPSAWVEAGPVTVSAITKYYYHGGQRIAIRQGDVVYFIHSDHLGSTSLTTDITGTVVAETRYLPYGGERWITGTLVTDFTFTGQRAERGFGLMDYNARYYDPWLGRFVSPDSIIPSIGDPQALDRYAYTYNNPLKYNDPSGHCIWDACLVEATALAIAGIAVMVWYYEQTQTPEFQQAVQDITEQVGTAFNPPPVPASNPDAFPLGPPPDPYYVPGPTLDTPEWSGLPGVPLDQPDTGTRAIDLPLLDQPGIGDNVLSSDDSIIYRGGGTNPGSLTPRPQDEGELSFRNSLSNPWPLPEGQRPPLPAGKPYFGVDTSKLPPGSVVYDDVPPGHVFVKDVPVEVIKDAIIEKGKFPK